MATTDLERQSTSKVDVADVPSRDWGWSGIAPNAARIAGVLFAAFLLLMTHGNHQGKTEDIFLVGFAVAILGIILINWISTRRKKWKY
ncbi:MULTISPECIES: DUF2631 domain-containing protein [Tsukamurella]|uniref:DUF2631 domain-containing protein n=2 Tax=Tsukamurella TaxID=2060 RepID=A0A5C5RXR0_9ACTN|nr:MULTISPECIES: DUF2631 domain-containing protein [Tsukamurella]NMD56238.1 DUF2631 domain-containing protein [Tsukamurella columbiensis]TWS27210.1 DUF2631 domain-containing protein [Tsukamurella conjunctivitidis]